MLELVDNELECWNCVIARIPLCSISATSWMDEFEEFQNLSIPE